MIPPRYPLDPLDTSPISLGPIRVFQDETDSAPPRYPQVPPGYPLTPYVSYVFFKRIQKQLPPTLDDLGVGGISRQAFIFVALFANGLLVPLDSTAVPRQASPRDTLSYPKIPQVMVLEGFSVITVRF